MRVGRLVVHTGAESVVIDRDLDVKKRDGGDRNFKGEF